MFRLSAVLLLALATLSAQDRKADGGFVVDVRGEWINLRTGKPVQPIDSLSEGDVIRASKNASASDYIILSLPDGSHEERHCRAAGDCGTDVTVPHVEGDRWWTRVSESIRALNPAVVRTGIIGASRSGSGPAEAVLEIGRAGEVGLSPALITVEPGDYTAQLTTWPKQDEASERTVFGPLNWDPPHALWKPKAPVFAGLYMLTVIDRDNQSLGTAAVLIAANQDYSRFQSAFERLKDLTNSWNLPRDAEQSIRALHASFLVALSSDHSLSEVDR